MTSVQIRTVADLHLVRANPASYGEIVVDARTMKCLGLLRHAFKYAAWGLNEGGLLHIHDEPSVSLLFSPRRVDFWQVRREFFKSVGRHFDAQEVDDKRGFIRATKRGSTPSPRGISFGIVFGGGDKDAQMLCEAIASIAAAARTSPRQVEVLVCGTVAASLKDRIVQLAPGLAVRYLSYEAGIVAGRIPIADKKNKVFDAASFDAIVVSHTRIRFAPDFVTRLLASRFDVLAPAVWVDWQGAKRRFLDYILIGSYDLSKRNPSAALGSFSCLSDHLLGMRKRVPYVDGGVMVFNRTFLESAPFDGSLAWGEAEDVDACAKLYQQGMLIDFDAALHCESATVKFAPVPGPWFRVTWPLKRWLVHKGVF